MWAIDSAPLFHAVTFTGPFGYLKPWTAVRDGETYSQQFLTPSVIEGMRQKLGVSAILRHKLRYAGMSMQQERTEARGGLTVKREGSAWKTNRGILTRGVLLAPQLTLAFDSGADAEVAATQHLCLCRNEDIVLPSEPFTLTETEFDELPGFELLFAEGPEDGAFLVGYNRFRDGAPMYGRLDISSNPLAKDFDR